MGINIYKPIIRASSMSMQMMVPKGSLWEILETENRLVVAWSWGGWGEAGGRELTDNKVFLEVIKIL